MIKVEEKTVAQSPIISLMQREIEQASSVIAASDPALQAVGFRTLGRSLKAYIVTLEKEARRIETTEYQKAVTAYRQRQQAAS